MGFGILSWWCSDLKVLSIPNGRCYLVHSLVQLIEGNLSLKSSEVDIRIAHQCTGFLTQLQSKFGTAVTFVEGRNVALAHLDAYLATVVACFSDNAKDKVRFRRKKRYSGTLRRLF